LLTDEAFAVASIHYRGEDRAHSHWFTLGTGLTLWVPWQISTMLGITLGSYIPESWSLDFALPITFMALLTPTLTDRPAWATSVSAGLMSVALAGLPYKLGLLLAALFGVAAGLIVEGMINANVGAEG
jgi:predicted branched-subunit amino acid permease